MPQKDEETGTARKCTFCNNRIKGLQEPACVEACPTRAIQFGKRADMIAVGMAKVGVLKDAGYNNANLYAGDELGGLHVIYVLDDSPSVYGLPDLPRPATVDVGIKWLSGTGAFLLAAVLPLWFIFKRKMQSGEMK